MTRFAPAVRTHSPRRIDMSQEDEYNIVSTVGQSQTLGISDDTILDALSELERAPDDAHNLRSTLGKFIDMSTFALDRGVEELSANQVPQSTDDFPAFIRDALQSASTSVTKSAYHVMRAGNRVASLSNARQGAASLTHLVQEAHAKLLQEKRDAASWIDCAFAIHEGIDDPRHASAWLAYAAFNCPFWGAAVEDFCDAWTICGNFSIVVHVPRDVAVLLQKIVDAYNFETFTQFEHYLCALRQRPITSSDQASLQAASDAYVSTHPVATKTSKPLVLGVVRSRKRWTAEFRNAVSHNRFLTEKVRKLERILYAKAVATATASGSGLGGSTPEGDEGVAATVSDNAGGASDGDSVAVPSLATDETLLGSREDDEFIDMDFVNDVFFGTS